METIKAVEMVRQIRDAEYEITKDMSDEELKVYFHNAAKWVNDEAFKFINKQRQERMSAKQVEQAEEG